MENRRPAFHLLTETFFFAPPFDPLELLLEKSGETTTGRRAEARAARYPAVIRVTRTRATDYLCGARERTLC